MCCTYSQLLYYLYEISYWLIVRKQAYLEVLVGSVEQAAFVDGQLLADERLLTVGQVVVGDDSIVNLHFCNKNLINLFLVKKNQDIMVCLKHIQSNLCTTTPLWTIKYGLLWEDHFRVEVQDGT